MSAIEILTFGCRLNAFESEVMRKHADNAGLGDAVTVNTCAVTNAAVAQAAQANFGRPASDQARVRSNIIRRSF